jgi:acyl-CoA thioesterase FadM
MPEKLPYSNTVRVRFSDTDAQGHLYFANYMVYADEVAVHYMEELALARGSITQVFVDHETRKSCEIPQEFKTAIVSRQPDLA